MSFDQFFQHYMRVEGGYVNDPRDSGGETMNGVTILVARRYGYTGAMRHLPIETTRKIIKSLYWDKIGGDAIAKLSPKVAIKLADISVNMGVKRAGQFLQRLLNGLNNEGKIFKDIKEDGAIGKGTIQAVEALHRFRGADGMVVLYKGLNCLQGAFYISLVEKRPKDEAFLYGWLLNRVD